MPAGRAGAGLAPGGRPGPRAAGGSSREHARRARHLSVSSTPRATETPECVGSPSSGSTETSTMRELAEVEAVGQLERLVPGRTTPTGTMPTTVAVDQPDLVVAVVERGGVELDLHARGCRRPGRPPRPRPEASLSASGSSATVGDGVAPSSPVACEHRDGAGADHRAGHRGGGDEQPGAAPAGERNGSDRRRPRADGGSVGGGRLGARSGGAGRVPTGDARWRRRSPSHTARRAAGTGRRPARPAAGRRAASTARCRDATSARHRVAGGEVRGVVGGQRLAERGERQLLRRAVLHRPPPTGSAGVRACAGCGT